MKVNVLWACFNICCRVVEGKTVTTTTTSKTTKEQEDMQEHHEKESSDELGKLK